MKRKKLIIHVNNDTREFGKIDNIGNIRDGSFFSIGC